MIANRQTLEESPHVPVGSLALENRADRKRVSSVAVKLFLGITQGWGLSNDQKRRLLGDISKAAFHNWAAGKVSTLSRDQLERISLCLGIEKGIKLVFSDDGYGARWLKAANTDIPFNGQVPLKHMTEQGILGLYQTRQYLDAWRGVR